jgi:predicted permease
VRALQLTAPLDIPRIDEARFDLRAMLFTALVTVGSGVLVGLVPALRAARVSAGDLLRSSATTTSTGRRSGRLRWALVSIEVAASAVCLVAGALLLSSFVNLLAAERGFNSARVVTIDFMLLPPRYDTESGARFLSNLVERARALPGVRAAGVTDVLPLSGVSNSAILVEGSSAPRPERPSAMIRMADRGYFDAMGISLVEGRLLQEGDTGVAVISRRAAERLWPGQRAIGKRFRHGPDDSPLVQVVGVVNDVRGVSLVEQPPLLVYRSSIDSFYGLAALAVRTDADSRAVGSALRQLLRAMDPQLAAPAPLTMDEIVEASVAERRFQMNLVLILGLAAVFLSALGIYAVVAQTVVQRTAEFGVRMALGAGPSKILGLVVRRTMAPVGVGLAAGLAASVGAAQLLRSLLFEARPTDALPFAGATLFLLTVALVASIIPARRAMRVNPLEALRVE